ncbi:MAG: ABC transporter permease subunit [Kiritimatiellae bacterium]|nr:ABC transporter permease subunit [Kiritimatiellia bacterium]
MIGKRISRQVSLACACLSVLSLVAAYSLLSRAQHIKNPDDRTIPTWRQLWDGVVFLCEKPDPAASDTSDLLAAALAGTEMEGEQAADAGGPLEGRILWEASRATLGRLFGGLAAGLVGGVVVGVLMGCFLKIDASVSPVMYFASRIIPTAAMPIFFKLTGIDLEMYVAMITFGSMPIVTLTVSRYVQDFPDELRHKAYTLGASHTEVITTAIFPYVLPKIMDLAILMIGPALVYLIAAEQIVAGEGFGYRIRVLTKATRFEVVYPLIAILTVYAGVITGVLRLLQRALCPWYKPGGR